MRKDRKVFVSREDHDFIGFDPSESQSILKTYGTMYSMFD